MDPTMAWNPHLKFYNDNCGYVNTRITKEGGQHLCLPPRVVVQPA